MLVQAPLTLIADLVSRLHLLHPLEKASFHHVSSQPLEVASEIFLSYFLFSPTLKLYSNFERELVDSKVGQLIRYNFAAVRPGTQLHDTVLPSTSSMIALPGPNLELNVVTCISKFWRP